MYRIGPTSFLALLLLSLQPTFAASFVNVTAYEGGTAQYSLKFLPTDNLSTVGPASVTAPNTSALVGSFSSNYASASNNFTSTSSSLSTNVSASSGWASFP